MGAGEQRETIIPDRFEDLRTFVAVAEQRSFAAAADQLGVVKSAVSRRIRELEGRLGVQLVSRTTRRFHLTDGGMAFYERSVALLAGLEEAEELAGRGASAINGRLRVSGPMSFGIHCLTPVVGEFLERHSGVSIELELDDRIVDVVHERFDLAVRIGRLADSSLIARRIAPIRHAVCASPDYLRRFGVPSTPEALAGHRALHYANADDPSIWRFRNPETGAVGAIEVPSNLKINNGDALREAAVAGFGITRLPTFIIHRAVQAGELKVLLGDHEAPAVGLYAVYPATRHLPARTRSFIDFLVERLGAVPYWDQDIAAASSAAPVE